MLSFVDEENAKSKSVGISDEPTPALEVIYGGVHATKPADIINVAEFIGVKGYKAKGKRVTTYIVEKLRFVPQHFAPTPEPEEPAEEQMEETITEEPLADNVATIAATPVKESIVGAESAPAAVEVEPAEEPQVSVADDDDVELEIILPKEEDDDHRPDSQQLNLF